MVILQRFLLLSSFLFLFLFPMLEFPAIIIFLIFRGGGGGGGGGFHNISIGIWKGIT